MVVNDDTHISNMQQNIQITAETLITEMQALGIDKSLIWLHPAQKEDEPCDYVAQNRYIYNASIRYPNYFLPVGWINPRKYPFNEIKKQIHTQIFEYGFKGIKLNGAQNFYSLSDENLVYPVIEEIVKTGAFLAFHCGNDPNTNPQNVKKIAKMFPDTKILMVHMGQTLCDDAISAAQECQNIILIGSGMPDRTPIVKAVKTLSPQRVCFGSDAPFFSTKDILREYHLLLDDMLSGEELEDIFANNILRFFI